MKIVIDTETNGLDYNSSVLSFSCLTLDDNNYVIDILNRYYYKEDKEADNSEALKTNGLYKNVISAKREIHGANYPKYFKDDLEILEILNDDDLEKIIAHNIEFDIGQISQSFNLNPTHFKNKELYCTMLNTQYVYDAPYMKNDTPKLPNLKESVNHFGIDTNELFFDLGEDYHSSLFDVYCTYFVFRELIKL